MSDILDIHEFFVEGGDQERSHVLLHITEPSTPEEKERGYFFAVCELNTATNKHIETLQQLIDRLETGYYQAALNGNKMALEMSLEEVNRRGHQLLTTPDMEVNCAVGSIVGHTLTMSYHGAPSILILHSDKDGVGQHKSLVERSDNQEDRLVLFNSVVQGPLRVGDVLTIATPHVIEYLTPDRLQKIILSRSGENSTAHIQKSLSDLRNGLSFGGIIFHILAAEDAPRSGRQPKFLSDKKPSVVTPNHARAEDKADKIEMNYRPRPQPGEEQSRWDTLLVSLGRGVVVGTLTMARAAKKLFMGAGRMLTGTILLLTNHGGQRPVVVASMRQTIARQKRWLQNLPLVSKLACILVVLLAVAFMGSLGYIRLKERRVQALQQSKNLVQAIIDKKTAADASALYGDNAKAIILLGEAQNLLHQLGPLPASLTDLHPPSVQDLQTSLDAVRRLHVLQPVLIVDLSANHSKVAADQLVAIDDAILAYGATDPTLYQIHPNTKTVAAKTHDTIPHLLAGNTPKEQDTVLFLTPDNGLAAYDKTTGNLHPEDITAPAKQSKLAALFVYNQRLYTLDPATNQVYKHAKTQTGYDKGTPWLKDSPPDLHAAVSLAIDGDLFVLTDRDLLKFVAGRPAIFAIVGLDPMLDHPSKVWTYNGIDQLYILEPTHKRLIILDKTGKLLGQYTAREWSHPTDFVVDEKKKVGYVIDNNKVYQFKLE